MRWTLVRADAARGRRRIPLLTIKSINNIKSRVRADRNPCRRPRRGWGIINDRSRFISSCFRLSPTGRRRGLRPRRRRRADPRAGFARRPRSARLGGDDLGVDRSGQGARRGCRRPTPTSAASARWSRPMSRCSSCSPPARRRSAPTSRQFAARLHRRLRHRLCELDRRQLRQFRRGDAGRPAEIRHRAGRCRLTNEGGFIVALIARPGHRQLLSALRRMAQGGDPARALHQDRHRHSRRLHRRDRGGQAQPRLVAAAARRRGDRRGLSDLLGGGLFHRPQMVRLQPRMGGAARLGHFDLRRRGGDRHRRRDPRPAAGAGAGVVAGRRLRRRRSADPAVPRPDVPLRTSRWSPPPGSAWRSRPTARRSPPAASPSR